MLEYCTAGINHFTVVSLASFGRGGTARHCGDQQSGLFHHYSLGDDTAMPAWLHARRCHVFPVCYLVKNNKKLRDHDHS